jgi:excisionase family DNA binding protein
MLGTSKALRDSHGGRWHFSEQACGETLAREKGFCGEARELVQETGQEKMADSREVMNVRQASDYLGVSPDTLYKYVGEERIPAFKLGNRWRFKKSRLDQWMEEKSSQLEPGARQKAKAATRGSGSQ